MLPDGRFTPSGIARTILAVLATSSLGGVGLQADEGFIMQPKLQTTDSVASGIASTHPIQSPPDQSFLNQRENPKLEAKPVTFSHPVPYSDSEHNALRWVSRGSSPSLSASVPQQSIPQLSPEPRSLSYGLTQPPLVIDLPHAFASQVPPSVPGPESTALQTQPALLDERSAEAERRAELAASVSSQIIASANRASQVPVLPPTINAWPGWQAVGERLRQHMQQCEALLGRNAYFSAQEEAEQALLHLVRVLDWMNKQNQSEPAWHVAQQTLREADDFAIVQRLASDKSLLQRIINSHQTPVLKSVDVSGLAPMAAAQLYREFAQQKLVEASQGHPWASEVYYSLGRSFQAQADSDTEAQESLRWRAIAYYRSAQIIDPRNSLASNQLGYILLQMDRPSDASQALIASYNAGANAACLRNLIEACRRLGDSGTQQWAMQNLVAIESKTPPSSSVPLVTEISSETFAAISPITIGPGPRTAAASLSGTGPVQR